MSNVVRLPWPPRQLSPNARCDRRAIAGIRKRYRETCGWEAKAAKLLPGTHVAIRFCPPDRIRRDVDNMLASIKSGLDGVADAIGQDDSEWITHTLSRGPVEKGGAVYIEIGGKTT
jgi:crossover junction endodeoxyribonuclease RusA